MRSAFLLLVAFALLGVVEASGHVLCSKKDRRTSVAKTTIAAPQEDDYEVQYLKLDLAADNTGTAISGRATIVAKVVVAAMPEYYFELSNQLTIDSSFVNGQAYTVSTVSSVVRKITLGAPLLQDTVFTVDIYYHGAPTGGTGFFTNGLLHQTDNSVPVQVTHTVSAAVHARDWYPCKQSLTDKIDAADVWVTVPAGLKVAGNGLLQQVTNIGTTHQRFEWSTQYPVDYYLLSFAIAPYVEYNYFMHFSTGDSMLVQNYIYNTPSVLQQHQDELDSIQHIINHFSAIFGQYPFDQEKIGICMAPLGGGMENQTMVTLGSLDISLIAHELAHQWWGNSVTCQSLQDMWLNEGWATYCEQLYLEQFWGPQAARQRRTSVFNLSTASLGGSVYVSDTTQESRIYSGRLTYNKGAGVAHMLRYMINNDSIFFQVLRNYHLQYKYKTATTDDLRALAEQASGIDLDTFFAQWVYKEGFPRYSGQWAQSGSSVVVKINQNTSAPASVPVFKLPVELQLRSALGDTVVRLPNDFATQYYTLSWNKPIDTIIFDPENHIMDRSFAFTPNPLLLAVPDVGWSDIEIAPNPTSGAWRLRHLPEGAGIMLTDMLGRRLWNGVAGSGSLDVPSDGLAPGSFVLTVFSGGKARSYTVSKL